MSMRGKKKMTFDRTFEAIRIISELRSQIPKSAPDADIMQIIACSSNKCGLFWSHSNFMTKQCGYYPHYHFFRATHTGIHLIKMNRIWIQISYSSPSE